MARNGFLTNRQSDLAGLSVARYPAVFRTALCLRFSQASRLCRGGKRLERSRRNIDVGVYCFLLSTSAKHRSYPMALHPLQSGRRHLSSCYATCHAIETGAGPPAPENPLRTRSGDHSIRKTSDAGGPGGSRTLFLHDLPCNFIPLPGNDETCVRSRSSFRLPGYSSTNRV